MFIINKYLLIILSILVVLALLLFGNFGSEEGGIVYVTSKVDRGDIVSTVTSTGRIKPTIEVQLMAEVSGEVKNVYVETNSNVKNGDVLAKIDPTSYESDLNQANARLNKSSVELSLNKKVYETNKLLYDKNLISREELDESKAMYNSSFAMYEEAKTQLRQAKINLEKTEIKSGIDGIILIKNVNVGQFVFKNSEKPLFEIANNLNNMQLNIQVSEADIGKVENGQKVNFRVSAFPEKIFKGEISLISNSARQEGNLVTYDVLATIDNPDLLLKPGMTAEVNIIVASKKDILRIPTAALRFVPSESDKDNFEYLNDGYSIWFKDKGSRLSQLKIQTGISNQDYTELIGNQLEEGFAVIVDSYIKGGSSKSLFTLPQPKRF